MTYTKINAKSNNDKENDKNDKKTLLIPGARGLSLGRSTIENVHMREN